jgi:hypothetical protein
MSQTPISFKQTFLNRVLPLDLPNSSTYSQGEQQNTSAYANWSNAHQIGCMKALGQWFCAVTQTEGQCFCQTGWGSMILRSGTLTIYPRVKSTPVPITENYVSPESVWTMQRWGKSQTPAVEHVARRYTVWSTTVNGAVEMPLSENWPTKAKPNTIQTCTYSGSNFGGVIGYPDVSRGSLQILYKIICINPCLRTQSFPSKSFSIHKLSYQIKITPKIAGIGFVCLMNHPQT